MYKAYYAVGAANKRADSEILLEKREHQAEDINDRGSGYCAVKAVEHTAVSGKQKTVILDSVRAFYDGGDKVAALSYERNKQTHYRERYIINMDIKEAIAYNSVEHGANACADYRTDSTLDRLFR